MKIMQAEAFTRLEKMHEEKSYLDLALSPQGFLLMKQSAKVFESSDYRLYVNGKWCKRSGFQFLSSFAIPQEGLPLGTVSGRKVLVPYGSELWEYSTPKRFLDVECSFFLLVRLEGRIMLVVADGRFSPEIAQVALLDTPSNERFALALLRAVLGPRDQAAADALAKEEDDEAEEQ